LSTSSVLAYTAAALIAAWGVAHAIPTRAVVAGFNPISRDNRLVITQEWLVEALAMWFIAAIVIVPTAIAGPGDATTWIYRTAAVTLLAIGTLTAATGARTPVVWFKICPVLLASAATLLLVASFL